jgi:hypothetical protein
MVEVFCKLSLVAATVTMFFVAVSIFPPLAIGFAVYGVVSLLNKGAPPT